MNDLLALTYKGIRPISTKPNFLYILYTLSLSLRPAIMNIAASSFTSSSTLAVKNGPTPSFLNSGSTIKSLPHTAGQYTSLYFNESGMPPKWPTILLEVFPRQIHENDLNRLFWEKSFQ